MLYAMANSKLTNGQMPGSEIVIPITLAEKIVLAINAVCTVLIILLAFNIFWGFRKWKKQMISKVEMSGE